MNLRKTFPTLLWGSQESEYRILGYKNPRLQGGGKSCRDTFAQRGGDFTIVKLRFIRKFGIFYLSVPDLFDFYILFPILIYDSLFFSGTDQGLGGFHDEVTSLLLFALTVHFARRANSGGSTE